MNRLEKRCCDCGHVKPLEDFHVNLAMPDGRQYRCKACRSLYDQWRRAPHATISRLLVHWKPPSIMVNTRQSAYSYEEAQAG